MMGICGIACGFSGGEDEDYREPLTVRKAVHRLNNCLAVIRGHLALIEQRLGDSSGNAVLQELSLERRIRAMASAAAEAAELVGIISRLTREEKSE